MAITKEIITNKIKEMQANDDNHIMDRMIDVTYGMTTKVPVLGKFAKTSLDKMDALGNAKKFSSKLFKPFFPFPKVDKKYTEKFVAEKTEESKDAK